jgi:23S rRNA (uracil1939-C5)-methyltransferase
MHCRHFGACGGCSLPGLPYPVQLERKRIRLGELLETEAEPLLASPRDAGFRSKAAFVFGTAPHGGLVMGHFAASSKRIVAVEECPVHAQRANRIAFALRDRLARAGVRAADAESGLVRHVVVRTTEDESEAVAMLVVTRNDKVLRPPIRSLLASADRPEGFCVNVNDKPGPYMIGPDTIQIEGRSHVREKAVRIGGQNVPPLTFLVSPTAFFQSNVGAARQMVRLVTESLRGANRVLDLYSGSGLFALPLALAGATVTAIEENRLAVEDLKSNIRLNRMPNGRIRPVCGRVEDVVARISREPWDAVVLDPPRDGCAPQVLEAVFERIAPGRAVYVSCNPDRLAADLPRVRRMGYRAARIQAIDMFPHTDHMETIVVLHREAPPTRGR